MCVCPAKKGVGESAPSAVSTIAVPAVTTTTTTEYVRERKKRNMWRDFSHFHQSQTHIYSLGYLATTWQMDSSGFLSLSFMAHRVLKKNSNCRSRPLVFWLLVAFLYFIVYLYIYSIIFKVCAARFDTEDNNTQDTLTPFSTRPAGAPTTWGRRDPRRPSKNVFFLFGSSSRTLS